MKIGTKSVLFGAHAFWLHPWFVAWAWTKLYGFPTDYRLWVAFFVHDLGYVGKPNMDGPEGEDHVQLGGSLMRRWFGFEWRLFTLCHSRYFCKKWGVRPSALCYADKLATVLIPWWIYVPLVRLTGEIREYKSAAKHRAEHGAWDDTTWRGDRAWFQSLQKHLEGWTLENAPQIERERTRVPA